MEFAVRPFAGRLDSVGRPPGLRKYHESKRAAGKPNKVAIRHLFGSWDVSTFIG
jgi:hypothetical protein